MIFFCLSNGKCNSLHGNKRKKTNKFRLTVTILIDLNVPLHSITHSNWFQSVHTYLKLWKHFIFFSFLIQQYLIDHWSDDFKTCWFVEKCYNSLLSLATSRTSIQIFKNQREKKIQNDWHKLIDLTSSKTLSHTHAKCNNVNSHAICLENCFLSSLEFHWNVIYIKRN